MIEHPTFEDLEKRVMELEKANAEGRRAEARLREVEDDYQTLVDNLSAGVYRNTGGPKGRFIRANPAIAQMFGYDSVEAFMEVSVADLYVDPEERRRFVDEVRKSGFVKEWELRLKQRDGSPFWASCTATVKYDEEGGIQWMDGIIYDISDRKEAEERLRESEEEHRTLIDNLSVGVYRNTGGPKGRFIRANPAIAQMFGYDSVDAFKEVSVADLYVDPEERQRFVDQVRKSGFVKEWELRLKQRDGSPFWASCTATLKRDEDGGIQWMDGIIYDISDRKEAEERLQQSEEEHRTLVENLSAGVYRNTGGPKGHFIRANPAIAEMFGYDSVDAFMKVSVADLYVDPEERQRFVDEVRKSGFVREWELRLKQRDGSPFWASCTATVKRDEAGGIQWMDGIIYDISDRKQAEKALRRTNEVLNNILTASPVGIGLLDKGAIRWANGEMVRMFGFENRNDYVGKSIRIVYPNDDEYDRVFSVIKRRFQSGQPPEVDAEYRRKDGTTFVGHFKMSCPDPEEPSKRAVFAINDISWRAQAETEKLEREKVQAVLETAGAVCHEMNQPLQGITSLSETLLMNLRAEELYGPQVKRIMDLTSRMSAITRKLMGITKYETKDYVQGIRIIDLDKSSG